MLAAVKMSHSASLPGWGIALIAVGYAASRSRLADSAALSGIPGRRRSATT